MLQKNQLAATITTITKEKEKMKKRIVLQANVQNHQLTVQKKKILQLLRNPILQQKVPPKNKKVMTQIVMMIPQIHPILPHHLIQIQIVMMILQIHPILPHQILPHLILQIQILIVKKKRKNPKQKPDRQKKGQQHQHPPEKKAAPKAKRTTTTTTTTKTTSPTKPKTEDKPKISRSKKTSDSEKDSSSKSSSQSSRKKTKDEEPSWKWWLEEALPEGKKWKTLEHQGVLFPPPYQPHGVKILYDGKSTSLTPEQEEIATYFAHHLESAHMKKPQFRKNFWNDFQKISKKSQRKHCCRI